MLDLSLGNKCSRSTRRKRLNVSRENHIKKKIECSVEQLVSELNSQMPSFLKHVYNTGHQHKAIKDIRENLKPNEAECVIDFSQNYNCKFSNEIQSVHFGASKKQISLHTGAFFHKVLNENNKSITKCVSFCSISECLRHDASSIWAHMQPILTLMKTCIPRLEAIHFQSDGPSTQYKNKTNFDLFQYHCNKVGLKNASWNFTTSGHGKSCADGTGGTVKGLCDRAVGHGKDIYSTDDILKVVDAADSPVKMFLVTENDINNINTLVPSNLKAINQTNKIHQTIWKQNTKKTLYLSSLFCTKCLYSPPCNHFQLNPDSFEFLDGEVKTSTISKRLATSNVTKRPVRRSQQVRHELD